MSPEGEKELLRIKREELELKRKIAILSAQQQERAYRLQRIAYNKSRQSWLESWLDW